MIGELDYFTHSEHGVMDWFRDNEPVVGGGLHDHAHRQGRGASTSRRRMPTQPFYLYLTFNAPHTPYQAPEEYRAKYAASAEPTRRTYAAWSLPR
jgi:hypothetical protein